MPAKTANGLPYPLPTEPTRDGAAAIQSLATALEGRGHGLRVEARGIQVTANAAGGFGFDFARPFTGPPVVVLTSSNNQAGAYMLLAVILSGGVSTGRLEGYVMNQAGAATNYAGPFWVNYIAVGPDAAL